jgi:hypothetical protein
MRYDSREVCKTRVFASHAFASVNFYERSAIMRSKLMALLLVAVAVLASVPSAEARRSRGGAREPRTNFREWFKGVTTFNRAH